MVLLAGGRVQEDAVADINPIAAPEAGIGVPKHLEEAGHRLQAGEAGGVEAILHVGDGNDGAHQQTFSICPEGGLWQACHRLRPRIHLIIAVSAVRLPCCGLRVRC